MIALARNTMATRFEIVLPGTNTVGLQAAGEEALDEIERLHNQLSLFLPSSEIAHVNARAAYEPVRVDPRVFELLQHAEQLHRETGGAFDITIAPLVRCWGFMGGSGAMPAPAALAEARSKVGMHLVRLNPSDFTVRFEREGVMLDLGAIGKGYAVERAANLLREAGITSAFLHGGTSTAYALGAPPDGEAWKVSIEQLDPKWAANRKIARSSANQRAIRLPASLTEEAPTTASSKLLTVISLKDEALSVSAIWGKYFQAQGQAYGHIIDPRTGYPASKAILTAISLPSATETDALTTAMLTAGLAGFETISSLRAGMRALIAESSPASGDINFLSTGLALQA